MYRMAEIATTIEEVVELLRPEPTG